MAKDRTPTVDMRAKFREAGFEMVEVAGDQQSFAVKKNHCTHLIKLGSNGTWKIGGQPTFNILGLDCELEDRGYQKFWYHHGRRFPVRVDDLRSLHQFDQEVRAILGMGTLYHESLGTASARSVYDRLSGRPDEP